MEANKIQLVPNCTLTKTFLHIEGIGEKKERELWQRGFCNWNDVLEKCVESSDEFSFKSKLYNGVYQSYQAFLTNNWNFFNLKLPSIHRWRAFEALAKEAIYLDIETDGIFSPNSITVIGIYSNRKFMPFIKDINLYQASSICETAPLVVTYSGTRFDLPLIKLLFPKAFSNAIHIDLSFPLRRLGFKGGLKKIETCFGIRRPEEVANFSGYDAVKLWQCYRQGSNMALELLLKYNECDTINLSILMESIIQECKNRWLLN